MSVSHPAPGLAAPPAPAVPAAPEESRWFSDEVKPLERSLRSYLRGAYPTIQDVDDLVQESYLRMLKARAIKPIQSARAFLFCVARRVAVDAIRKDRRHAFRQATLDSQALQVPDEKANAAEVASIEQEMELLAEALHALPARCREVMVLRKFERLSVQETADRLNISVATVETQVSRGMQKCSDYLRKKGVTFPDREGRP